MSHTLAHLGAPWYEHLVDSVRALGLAAREWQLAAQAAAVTEAAADVDRIALHEGVIAGRPVAEATGYAAQTTTRTPHSDAAFEVHRLMADHHWLMRRHYERAALLYASGATWALREVHHGRTPARVELLMDTARRLQPTRFVVPDLAPYTEARALQDAYGRVVALQAASDAADEIAGRTAVSDLEASEMTAASEAAEGLADAACRLGSLAEPALRYVLLTVRQQRAEETR